MELHVFLLLLGGAACHAAWNAMVKLRLDPFDATILISAATGVVVLPGVYFFGVPAPASWPYILASLAIHFFYYATLIEAYRAGDLGQVYPVARGSAPLMTAVGSLVILREPIGAAGWLGILTLSGGIMLLWLRGSGDRPMLARRALMWAFGTACTIAAYSIVDGQGARLSGSPHAYIVWLFVLDAIMMLSYGLARRGGALLAGLGRTWSTVLLGGAFSAVSYWIAIWAMTKAPVALVSAVRETSVLFAAIFSVVLLKERLLPARVAAAVLVVAGLVMIRLA